MMIRYVDGVGVLGGLGWNPASGAGVMQLGGLAGGVGAGGAGAKAFEGALAGQSERMRDRRGADELALPVASERPGALEGGRGRVDGDGRGAALDLREGEARGAGRGAGSRAIEDAGDGDAGERAPVEQRAGMRRARAGGDGERGSHAAGGGEAAGRSGDGRAAVGGAAGGGGAVSSGAGSAGAAGGGGSGGGGGGVRLVSSAGGLGMAMTGMGSEASGGTAKAGAGAEAGARRADGEAVVRAAARGISSAIAQKGGAITIRLIPETLGALRIQVEVDGGKVGVRIEATTAQAAELLGSQSGSLRQSLEARGMQVDRIQVVAPSVEQARAGAGGEQRGGGGQSDAARDEPGGDGSGARSGHERGASEQRGRGSDDAAGRHAGTGAPFGALGPLERFGQRLGSVLGGDRN